MQKHTVVVVHKAVKPKSTQLTITRLLLDGLKRLEAERYQEECRNKQLRRTPCSPLKTLVTIRKHGR